VRYLIKKQTADGLIPVETFEGDLNARIIELSAKGGLYMAEHAYDAAPFSEAPTEPLKKPRPPSAAKKKT
jgi:hypothetical protein